MTRKRWRAPTRSIKYDIAVLEEERDCLKKICNPTIRQYREKESEYQEVEGAPSRRRT